MNIKVLNIDGSKSKDIIVSDKITGLKVNNKLLKYVIDWQLNHSKKRLAKLSRETRLLAQLEKFMLKKELVEQDIQVEKHLYLLVEE